MSAVLAPSLRMVADSLSLTWRAQLTAAANKRYLKGNTFYTVTALGGMTVGFPCFCKAFFVAFPAYLKAVRQTSSPSGES
jgi:ABC transporter transmembrane region 2